MSTSDKQKEFSRKLSVLILVANEMGYGITLGRSFVSQAANEADGGHQNSLHLYRLAQDLNLFKGREYITSGEGHDKLHDVWDLMGGAPRIENDMNHYSLEHNGMR